MRFAHIADAHIGAWRNEKLRKLNYEAFRKAITKVIELKVDFLLIAGDLFNTALPSLDYLRETVKELMRLKENKINVYIIPGSHDYSPSGKTMINILEEAGLLTNVAKGEVVDVNGKQKIRLLFTLDKKTNTLITGIMGKKGSLDKKYFEDLDLDYINEQIKNTNFSIFMFHNGVVEFLPKNLPIDAIPISLLPKGFSYYACGHIHETKRDDKNKIYQPGPLFPNSFEEMKNDVGGFYLFDSEIEGDFDKKVSFIPIKVINFRSLEFDLTHKNPSQVYDIIYDTIKNDEFYNTIVLLKLKGVIEGKTYEIDFNKINKLFDDKKAYLLLRNINQLRSKDFEDINIEVKDKENIEDEIIKEHIDQSNYLNKDEDMRIIKEVLDKLFIKKQEGETKGTYEERVLDHMKEIFKIK